jgi:hypothetical protein
VSEIKPEGRKADPRKGQKSLAILFWQSDPTVPEAITYGLFFEIQQITIFS